MRWQEFEAAEPEMAAFAREAIELSELCGRSSL